MSSGRGSLGSGGLAGGCAPRRLAALNAGGNAQVASVSCWSPGNCAAGGFYTRRLGYIQAFVVSQQNGRWARRRRCPAART
jgi:hypothetical protein